MMEIINRICEILLIIVFFGAILFIILSILFIIISYISFEIFDIGNELLTGYVKLDNEIWEITSASIMKNRNSWSSEPGGISYEGCIYYTNNTVWFNHGLKRTEGYFCDYCGKFNVGDTIKQYKL